MFPKIGVFSPYIALFATKIRHIRRGRFPELLRVASFSASFVKTTDIYAYVSWKRTSPWPEALWMILIKTALIEEARFL